MRHILQIPLVDKRSKDEQLSAMGETLKKLKEKDTVIFAKEDRTGFSALVGEIFDAIKGCPLPEPEKVSIRDNNGSLSVLAIAKAPLQLVKGAVSTVADQAGILFSGERFFEHVYQARKHPDSEIGMAFSIALGKAEVNYINATERADKQRAERQITDERQLAEQRKLAERQKARLAKETALHAAASSSPENNVDQEQNQPAIAEETGSKSESTESAPALSPKSKQINYRIEDVVALIEEGNYTDAKMAFDSICKRTNEEKQLDNLSQRFHQFSYDTILDIAQSNVEHTIAELIYHRKLGEAAAAIDAFSSEPTIAMDKIKQIIEQSIFNSMMQGKFAQADETIKLLGKYVAQVKVGKSSEKEIKQPRCWNDACKKIIEEAKQAITTDPTNYAKKRERLQQFNNHYKQEHNRRYAFAFNAEKELPKTGNAIQNTLSAAIQSLTTKTTDTTVVGTISLLTAVVAELLSGLSENATNNEKLFGKAMQQLIDIKRHIDELPELIKDNHVLSAQLNGHVRNEARLESLKHIAMIERALDRAETLRLSDRPAASAATPK